MIPTFGFHMNDFSFFRILFILVFVLIITVFIVIFVKGIGQWRKNNNSPRLSVPAKVVSKTNHRSTSHTNHRSTSHTNYDRHTRTTNSYTVTFEVDSGDRMFFNVSGYDYNMLAEGDRGTLSFQGTRFLGFQRI